MTALEWWTWLLWVLIPNGVPAPWGGGGGGG